MPQDVECPADRFQSRCTMIEFPRSKATASLALLMAACAQAPPTAMGEQPPFNIEGDDIEGRPTLPSVYTQVEQKYADSNVEADQPAEGSRQIL